MLGLLHELPYFHLHLEDVAAAMVTVAVVMGVKVLVELRERGDDDWL